MRGITGFPVHNKGMLLFVKWIKILSIMMEK